MVRIYTYKRYFVSYYSDIKYTFNTVQNYVKNSYTIKLQMRQYYVALKQTIIMDVYLGSCILCFGRTCVTIRESSSFNFYKISDSLFMFFTPALGGVVVI